MAYDCFDRNLRSPYGIKEPAIKPPVLANKPNWMQRLLHLRDITFPNYAQLNMKQYQSTSNSGQTQHSGDNYETKLRADWMGGRRSDDVTFLLRPSTDITLPWPVGNNAGTPTTATKRHYPGRGPDARKPIYEPLTHSYFGVKSLNDHRRRDLVPIGGVNGMRSTGADDVAETVPTTNGLGYGLDYGPTPWRVPVYRKCGISLMAGPHQLATQQQYSGVASVEKWNGSVLIAPPAWSERTRGTRGASGILSRVQGPGRSNVPAAYVPREVR